MSTNRASAEDVEEPHVASTSLPGKQSTDQFPTSAKPNAFTELMKPKIKQYPSNTDAATQRTLYDRRDGLAAYTTDPASFPRSRVVYFNEDFVVINDLFPKATVHLLILPRDPIKSVSQPQEAFDDPQFLAMCRNELTKVKEIVAEELRRRLGQDSRKEKVRIDAMESDEPPDSLPPGRDWTKEIISGIHANPSMNHLHIHVLSRDMVSEPMKKRNHYLSFTTDFLVDLDQFPLSHDDHRRDYRHFPEDMHCWRCGKNFGNRMTRLKEHLAQEFEEWKRE